MAQKSKSTTSVQEAIQILLKHIGENPNREGLLDTPDRVIKSYKEFFGGYDQKPSEVLSKTFKEFENYDDIILLRNIGFQSHCEHHMVPFFGLVHFAYIPHKKIIGISKIARIIDVFSKRLQIQEALTIQIANAIENSLKPLGLAIIIDSSHQCLTTRGVRKEGANMLTMHMKGLFKNNYDKRNELLNLIKL